MYKRVVSIYICYSQRDGLNTSLYILFYLLLHRLWRRNHYIETRTERTHDVDIFNVIQKVQDTVIHLEVDEEQGKIT